MKEGDLIEFWDNVVYEVTDRNLNIFDFPIKKPSTEYGIFMGYTDNGDVIKIMHNGQMRLFLTIGVHIRVMNR
tara:strand:- start:3544 stop:3762 length:219 start_codon:yes stop_codon:yes gene_type:complete